MRCHLNYHMYTISVMSIQQMCNFATCEHIGLACKTSICLGNIYSNTNLLNLVPCASAFSVMKYKRLEDEGTLRGKLHKFNIHSIRKKSDRFAGYLKILTGVEPQVKLVSTMFQP